MWGHPERAFTPLEFLIRALRVAEAGFDTPEHFENEFRIKLNPQLPERDGDPTQYLADAERHWFFRVIISLPTKPTNMNYLGGMSIFLPESKDFCLNGYDAAEFVLATGWQKRRDMSLEASGIDGTYYSKRMRGRETSLYMNGRCIARIGITNRSVPGEHKHIATSIHQESVSCTTLWALAQHTGIHSIETIVNIVYEDGIDVKTQTPVRNLLSIYPISARAIAKDGKSVRLPDPKPGSRPDSWLPDGSCLNYYFLAAGPFTVIKRRLGHEMATTQEWIVHIPTLQLVPPPLLDRQGYLEQAGPECLASRKSGDRGHPWQEDLWCAAQGGTKLRLVARRVILDDAMPSTQLKASDTAGQDFYWFHCDRRTGTGKTSQKSHVLPSGKYSPVTDVEISARMDRECEYWARESELD